MTFARLLLTAIAFVPLALTAQGGPPNWRWVLDQPARLANGGRFTPTDSVRMFVNGTRVGAWPRRTLAVDGTYGFRIGKGTNLHITNLDPTRRHVPFPAPRS